MTEAGERAADQQTAGLWLAAQHEIVRRAAHEVKNALNGVAVNLEVVRGRLARPGAPADSAAAFADTATGQLERVTAYVEALLALARPAREPADVPAVLHSLQPLLEAAATAHDIQLSLTTFEPATQATSADPQVTRLVLVAALLAATERGARAAGCHAALGEAVPGGGASAVVVRVARDGTAPTLDDEVAVAATRSGIHLERAPDALTLTFPAVAG